MFTPVGLSLLSTLGFYLTITPGVAGGFVDYYILRPLLGQKRYSIDDFVIGGKLGEGGFGVVYKAVRKDNGRVYALKQVEIANMNRAEREEAVDEVRDRVPASEP